MMTTKNIGIAVKITTTVPRTLVDMLNKSLMFIGIWVSTMSTSLENLFRILPRGGAKFALSKLEADILGACVNAHPCALGSTAPDT